MQNISDVMWDTWDAGLFVGPTKPITRATISKRVLKKDGDSPWRSIWFLQNPETAEVPNIKSVQIDRRLGTDAATMKMILINQKAPTAQDFLDESHDGSQTNDNPTRRELGDLGKPGIYSFRRGLTIDESGRNPWSHDLDSTWVDMFIPNRVIDTFQGYGTDGSGQPHLDENLVLTGRWLIDKVEFRADGFINIECRDAAKLLIEQRLYPPIVPLDDYPLKFCADHTTTEVVRTTTEEEVGVPESRSANVARIIPHTPGSKSKPYISGNTPWYGANNPIYGHRPSHVFDGDESTYWLSVGNSGPTKVWSFEWIGADTRGEPVNQIRFKQKWGGYRVYIGVKVDGVWQGSNTVPYGHTSPPAYPNGSNIRYVHTFRTDHNNNWYVIDLPKTYQADEIRVVFTDLHNSGLGTYPYRAAIFELRIFHFQASTFEIIETVTEEDVETFHPGNANDYVEIIKYFLAWSGWFWPASNIKDLLLEKFFSGSAGRVWGDFFMSGAFPVEPPCIPASYWDNKSVMDGINQIKEILGYIFYIDSNGGAVVRPPNIWKTGNFVSGQGYLGVDSVKIIDEEKILIDYGVTLNDEALRSEIIVVSADDPSVFTVLEPGYAVGEIPPSAVQNYDVHDISLLGGQQRPMIVPNYPFGKAEDPNAQAEVDKFAYLISLWIHWSYRKSRFRIPGNPAFEPDDQVKIVERVSSEAYVHYIQGVASVMDMEVGTWYMDMDTHWLGAGPDAEWIVNIKDMHPALFAFLRANNLLPDGVKDDESTWPDGWFDYEPPVVEEDYPRIPPDYEGLFPLPPGVEWPGNVDFESDDGYNDYTEPPTGGGGSGGGGGTGGTVLACSNSFMRTFWPGGPRNTFPSQGGGCDSSGYRNFTMWTSSSHAAQTETITMFLNAPGIRAWQALARLFSIHNFKLERHQMSSYACRGIINGSGVNKWSNHSWGTALDVNYKDYPIASNGGKRIFSSDPLYIIGRQAEDLIRTNNGQRVFVWGNKWSTADPMHFQICAKPADIATGVKILNHGSGHIF